MPPNVIIFWLYQAIDDLPKVLEAAVTFGTFNVFGALLLFVFIDKRVDLIFEFTDS